MTREEFFKQRNQRKRKIICKHCGKELEIPNMYSEKVRNEVLSPFCATATIFTIAWLIQHGWHCTRRDATPSGAFLCPDCFKEGTPEYQDTPYNKGWCEQAEKWMNESETIKD